MKIAFTLFSLYSENRHSEILCLLTSLAKIRLSQSRKQIGVTAWECFSHFDWSNHHCHWVALVLPKTFLVPVAYLIPVFNLSVLSANSLGVGDTM